MSDITVFDPSPEREELKNLLPESVKKFVDLVPLQYDCLDETSLKRALYPEFFDTVNLERKKHSTFDTDQALRFAFWDEFDRAKKTERTMVLKQICAGTISVQTFQQKIIPNPGRFAWILNRPANYENKTIVQHAEYSAIIDRLAKVSPWEKFCRCHYSCQCHKQQGRPSITVSTQEKKCICKPECVCPPKYNSKIMEAQLKVYAMLDLRVHGSVPQVINNRNLNVNVNKTENQIEAPQPETLEELEKLRAELQARKEHLQINPSTDTTDSVIEGEIVEE